MSFFRDLLDAATGGEAATGGGGAGTAGGGPTPPAAVPNASRDADATTQPCTRFEGRIVEIVSIANAVPVTLNRARISAPYWSLAESATFSALPAGQSPKPAAVPTRAGSDIEMVVRIEVTKAEGLAGQAAITGTIGPQQRWEGQLPVAVGTHTVTVRMAAATTILKAHRGDIDWQADVRGCGVHQLGRTRVEIYRIVENTTPPYLSPGRPAEGLRFVYGMGVAGVDVGAGNPDGIREATARITTWLHGSHGLRYDTAGGESFYVDWAGGPGFMMYDYITRTGGSVVNCYDQASAVLVCAGILGIDGHKRFVQPFGFIQTTTLVGGIRSNNPFKDLTTPPSPALVDRLDPRRTSFGNHEFYMDRASGRAFDACAGPHLGTESFMEYMESSVDMTMLAPGREDPRAPPLWRSAWSTRHTGRMAESDKGYSDTAIDIRALV